MSLYRVKVLMVCCVGMYYHLVLEVLFVVVTGAVRKGTGTCVRKNMRRLGCDCTGVVVQGAMQGLATVRFHELDVDPTGYEIIYEQKIELDSLLAGGIGAVRVRAHRIDRQIFPETVSLGNQSDPPRRTQRWRLW